MTLKFVAFLPEYILLLGLLVMALVQKLRTSATPKTYYTLSKFILLLTLLFTIIFYNRSVFPNFYENTSYTSLFKSLIYIVAVVWFFLSNRWFLNEERSSFSFYFLALLSIAGLIVIVSAENFIVLGLGLVFNAVASYFLVKIHLNEESVPLVANRYLAFSLFFLLLLAVGCGIFYYQLGSLNYFEVYAFLQNSKILEFQYLLASGLILAAILYFMAIAPFHFWFLDVIKSSILPVSGYLTLVPVFAFFACFTDLIINVLYPVYHNFQIPMIVFAVLSLFMGAVGANGEKNILRLFAYSTVFNLGFILISLISFSANSLFSAFVYLVVYVLAMLGIYTSFLGFKSKGLYVFELREISGIAKLKPYLAAALLLFLVSLVGSPPMLGFLGKLSVINNLVLERHYYLIAGTMLSLLLVVNAYLIVVKTLYFDAPVMNFDRIDKSIYISLTINIIIVVISLIQPRFLMSGFERLLITIF